MKSLDRKSKFNIYSGFTLSNDDVSVISLLYTPLIGSEALMLYMAFTSFLERNNLKSESLTHEDFLEIYSMSERRFLDARIKLEGIGLLLTYYNKNENSYIYAICPPLTAKNFIKDVTLGLYLFSKIRKETFDFICNHFKIEKIEKSSYEDLTMSFDEVYESRVSNDETFEKFQYILGKKPNAGIKIKDTGFDFSFFLKEINQDFLETGVTKNFENQIKNIAFVYGFDESDMIGLYNDSINKSELYDYRLLKKKANILFNYKRNMKGPILVTKNEDDYKADDLISFIETASPDDLISSVVPDYPSSYLDIVLEIYQNIALPRGVINCMIIKVLKDKSGELPKLNYFKKVSESWIKDSIFTTKDAMKYITTAKIDDDSSNKKSSDDNGGFEEL
jgi:replication initiation and membrane attachment protein